MQLYRDVQFSWFTSQFMNMNVFNYLCHIHKVWYKPRKLNITIQLHIVENEVNHQWYIRSCKHFHHCSWSHDNIYRLPLYHRMSQSGGYEMPSLCGRSTWRNHHRLIASHWQILSSTLHHGTMSEPFCTLFFEIYKGTCMPGVYQSMMVTPCTPVYSTQKT
jgi:hypothetical protein